ncbi:hypothetical protein [Romboutsia timonensis]|uniref:hypothetical protein n=1 Tax=Romboutsia timonensis TaxID=1776391 RepID=UPI002A821D4F|nr:hypothetical protein [Romboutsia timonensis]MDY3960093.1 hypothetical protein [Romboutsia timonensis]
MFCKIRKGKNGYSVYLCNRKRLDGKVVSKDFKIATYGWHSLYEIDEEYNGLIEDIPSVLAKSLRLRLKDYDIKLIDVVDKLIEIKKEYYTTYKDNAIKYHLIFEEEQKSKEERQLKEYEEFKEKFRTLHYNEIMNKYKEGYDKGILEGILKSKELKSKCSVKNIDIGDEEKKLLKEAFKLLAMKHHPDRGGDTEKMAAINNLKEKIL